MIRNAIAYVSRKKKRTLIIFLLFSFVLSCLYSCLNIVKSGKNMEKLFYEASNSSLSITKTGPASDGYFSLEPFRDIVSMEGVQAMVPEYDGLAKVPGVKVVESEQKIELEGLGADMKNLVSIAATPQTAKHILFSSSVFTLKEGRLIEPEDKYKVLVHEDFAKKNQLKSQDEIALDLIDTVQSEANTGQNSKSHPFQIVGIFSGKKQEIYTGLSSDFSENMLFTDYEACQEIMGRTLDKQIANKISVFAADQESLERTLAKIKALPVDWSTYSAIKEDSAFEEVLESLGSVQQIIRIMTYAIMLAGVAVLSLLLVLWLRERIYEIGILLSIGVSKIKILGQFILELILISLPAIPMAFLLGNWLIRKLLGDLVSRDSTTDLSHILMQGQGILDHLLTFLQSYGILVLILLVSVGLSSSMILIQKPKKILSKIS